MSQDKIELTIFILFMIAICGTVWGCAGYKVGWDDGFEEGKEVGYYNRKYFDEYYDNKR